MLKVLLSNQISTSLPQAFQAIRSEFSDNVEAVSEFCDSFMQWIDENENVDRGNEKEDVENDPRYLKVIFDYFKNILLERDVSFSDSVQSIFPLLF